MTREEAIQIIRKNIPHLGIGATEMTEALNELIPELRESEDERVRKAIDEILKLDEVLEIAGKYHLSMVAIRDGFTKQKEQKPAWSEEDEDRIRQIERIAQQAGCTQKLQEEIHDWLKALRPGWKPTDKQMNVLGRFHKFLHESGSPDFGLMDSLLGQLKNL